MNFRKQLWRFLYVLVVIAVAWHINVLGLLGARFEPNDATDRVVMLTALAHLSEQERSDRGRNGESTVVYLNDETLLLETELYELWPNAWPRNWQLGSSFEERNASNHDLPFPSSGNLQVRDMEVFNWSEHRDDLGFRCSVRMSRPGYSRDGRMAMVKLQLQPSHHGTDVAYLLSFDGERWTVHAWSITSYG